jgi:alpha-glucosidase
VFVSEIWETINGKNKEVLNEYNLYTFDLLNNVNEKLTLEIRLYDRGFAYRFLIPEINGKKIEDSRIQFSEDLTFWAYNGENHNVGPVHISEYGERIVRNPVTFKTRNNHYFAIHEAAIFEHAPFVLANTDKNSFQLFQEIEEENATKTSWRAFILGDNPGDLTESDLLVNLNEPCKIEDPSWIKPGRAMWDWRVWGYTAPDGFQYGLNTISHKRFIDFAAENNVQYLLIDADWYGPEFDDNSDPTSAREGVNIEECMAYAKEKGVGVILYLNDVGANKFGLERILKQFSDWGAAGVKYGFMKGSPKEKVVNTRRIVELCANYKLMVNFHDNPVAPSGDRRTWPNLITKEFGHSQADAKRSYFPETIVTVPFVNMLAGPLDLCNGWFALNSAFTSNRHKVFEEIPGTVAAEVAKLIVVYGGCFVLPDAPEEYLKKDDLFDCIRKMPAHFDSYKVLDGEIGEFISVARCSGDDWFVGTLTNRESRELTIDFDFLDGNKKYMATFYEDTPETHFMENKEAYQIRENIPIHKNSQIKIKLAAGGGHSIWIRPVEP